MTNVLTQPAKCPECRHEIEDHWSLVMTLEELERWRAAKASGVCHRSRGEVLLMIEGIR